MSAAMSHPPSRKSRVGYRLGGVLVFLALALAPGVPWAADSSPPVMQDGPPAAAGTDIREQRVTKRVASGDTLPRLLMDLGVSAADQQSLAPGGGETSRRGQRPEGGRHGPLPLHRTVERYRSRRHDGPSNRARRLETVNLAVARRPDRLPQGQSHGFRGEARGAFGRGWSSDSPAGSGLEEDLDGSGPRGGAGDARAPEGRNSRRRAARQGSFQEGGAALDSGHRKTVPAETVVSGQEDRPLFRGLPRRRPNPASPADRIEGRGSPDVAMDRWADKIPGQKSSGSGGQSPNRAHAPRR